MISQQIIHYNSSLIQKNYALNIILKIKTAEETNGIKNIEVNGSNFVVERTRISDEIYFLICQSCFWCASYITNIFGTSAPLVKCPICIEGNIESMPIAKNERYKFDYDIKRGVTLEFSR